MFAVDNILISDDLVESAFACNLGACLGACCVQGDSGAPLLEEEIPSIEEAVLLVEARLRPQARRVIASRGAWETTGGDQYATTCVGGAECVFVTYDGPVAKCSIQQAHTEGKTDFPKPISCHLYPVRVEDLGEYEALNYEQIGICASGVKRGRREGIPLYVFLKEPLTRKYGKDWYERFFAACSERLEVLDGPLRRT